MPIIINEFEIVAEPQAEQGAERERKREQAREREPVPGPAEIGRLIRLQRERRRRLHAD